MNLLFDSIEKRLSQLHFIGRRIYFSPSHEVIHLVVVSAVEHFQVIFGVYIIYAKWVIFLHPGWRKMHYLVKSLPVSLLCQVILVLLCHLFVLRLLFGSCLEIDVLYLVFKSLRIVKANEVGVMIKVGTRLNNFLSWLSFFHFLLLRRQELLEYFKIGVEVKVLSLMVLCIHWLVYLFSLLHLFTRHLTIAFNLIK